MWLGGASFGLSALHRAVDVTHDRVDRHVECVVLPDLAAVGTDQESRNVVGYRAVALALTHELKPGELLVNLRGSPGEEKPAVARDTLSLGIVTQFLRRVVLRIEREGDDRHILPDLGPKFLCHLVHPRCEPRTN